MFDLNGKKAIITGGAQGLGFSIVEAFHNAGIEIAIIVFRMKYLIFLAN